MQDDQRSAPAGSKPADNLRGDKRVSEATAPRRVVVGVSGATGAVYGIRLLEILKTLPEVESHVIISPAAKRTLRHETDYSLKDVEALADVLYDYRDIGAAPASGSFRTTGMMVAPCSIKTAAALAMCYTDNLITRAGDVTLKEGRPLILVVRETPLHVGHLRMLTRLAESGGVILPPVPAFYHRPQTIDDLVNHTVGRLLDRIGLPVAGLAAEWRGDRARD